MPRAPFSKMPGDGRDRLSGRTELTQAFGENERPKKGPLRPQATAPIAGTVPPPPREYPPATPAGPSGIVTLSMPGGFLTNGVEGAVSSNSFNVTVNVAGMLKGENGGLAAAVQYVDYEPGLGFPIGDGYVLTSTVGGTRSWEPNPGGGSSHTHVESTATVTTASIADGATDDVALTGAGAGRLRFVVRAESSDLAWVRAYSSAAARTADAGRAPGTPPTGEHGCLMDWVVESGNLVWDLGPCKGEFRNAESPFADVIYFAIQNQSGGTTAITVTLTFISIETN